MLRIIVNNHGHSHGLEGTAPDKPRTDISFLMADSETPENVLFPCSRLPRNSSAPEIRRTRRNSFRNSLVKRALFYQTLPRNGSNLI